MKIPYVIDNQTNKLSDVLLELLASHSGRSLDVASAFFSVKGFELVRSGLDTLGSFRLLLGFEPSSGPDVGIRPAAVAYPQLLSRDIGDAEFTRDAMVQVEELIRFLRKGVVQVRLVDKGFLHAKCYLLYGDKPSGQGFLFERFQPLVGIVGSSNFTYPGLTSNRELNLCHRVLLDPTEGSDVEASQMVGFLAEAKSSPQITDKNRQLIKSEIGARAIMQLVEWYDREWEGAAGFKDKLIEILDASKFGTLEYSPYQVYMKALYEYFRDDLDAIEAEGTRSAVELSEFQEDAVKKARKILARYDGVMVADSVGLGKTWIGKKLLEDYAYHMRMKALVVCPASLRDMWTEELRGPSIAATVISQEELGRQEFDASRFGDADIIVVDESHNFRNRNAQRYENLERIISLNGGRGRDGGRKKVILLTATPINNDIFDLYNQIALLTQGDKSYFASAGIGDVHRYFLHARRDGRSGAGVASLFNLLEEVVIRRTRPFIRKAYPNATIKGKKISFPERKLRTVRYDLEGTYQGIYEKIVAGVESLKLAPYNLESYKKDKTKVDEFEEGREEALVGIFKSRYLKRFESSIDSFRISIRRALEFQKTFESTLLGGRLLASSDFQKALRYLTREDEEDDATPGSIADDFDASEDAKAIVDSLPEVNTSDYDLKKLHNALQHDIDILTDIWHKIKDIRSEGDAKLARLKELLSRDLKGQKVLIFTYYKDTARYLYRELGSEKGEAFRRSVGGVNIHRMDSGAKIDERSKIIRGFAPKANGHEEIKGTEEEIDILISTDVLSEGQNLQDCGHLLNYDLHWNPTRMVQRAGRIDRIGTDFKTLWVYNMFPDEGLEKLLGLVESLSQKIAHIDRAGFLDASVLGETVHPRNFNTLRRIADEDGAVFDEEEQFTDLMSNEFMLQQLRNLLNAGGRSTLEELPDGIHSGLTKPGSRGMFFYFKTKESDPSRVQHFWKYYDSRTGDIIDNRLQIAQLIACSADTPRVIGSEDPFEVQEKVIASILEGEERIQALATTPKTIDTVQQTIAAILQSSMNSPGVDRKSLLELLRYVNQPLPNVQVKELRSAHQEFGKSKDLRQLTDRIRGLMATYRSEERRAGPRGKKLEREQLRLVCFDYLCS